MTSERLKLIFCCAAVVLSLNVLGADFKYVEASDLTLIGKLFNDTPNPYHRVDTVRFKGFTSAENVQVRCSAGLAVYFTTNSPKISIYSEFGEIKPGGSTALFSTMGYDLYIKDEGRWLYAASKVGIKNKETTLIENMEVSTKECIIYLPSYSELYSCKIGIPEGYTIKAAPSPFRYRVGVFGSSFTQGVSTSRCGMLYSSQFTRRTGIQMLNLGCSGNCKMQDYFADVLCAADVDALLFDAFSNPSAEMIEERLFPFIEKVQAAHPDIPLIFMQTIHRCSRHFNKVSEEKEAAKMAMAETLMHEACKKYKNVYFIHPCANDEDHETSVDGTHPDNRGYQLWELSIEKPLLKILKKYGIN